jgi:hypothetical protein
VELLYLPVHCRSLASERRANKFNAAKHSLSWFSNCTRHKVADAIPQDETLVITDVVSTLHVTVTGTDADGTPIAIT